MRIKYSKKVSILVSEPEIFKELTENMMHRQCVYMEEHWGGDPKAYPRWGSVGGPGIDVNVKLELLK